MKKTDWMKLRATPIERAALEAIARQEARKPAEMLRELVRQEALRRGVWPMQAQGHGSQVQMEVRKNED